MSYCVTAVKRRYATRQAAERDARTLSFAADGQVMRVYRCRCGWWHLTRRGAIHLPAEEAS